MTAVMPLTLAHVKATEVGASLTAVGSSAYGGLEVAGTLGGIAGSLCAVVALIISVAAGNAKRRRQYDEDIRAAEERGRHSVSDELAELREIRTRYFNMLEARADARAHGRREPRPEDEVSAGDS